MRIAFNVLLFGSALLILASEAEAQLAEFTNADRFSMSSVLFDFSPFPPLEQAGLEASELYSKWGVTFSGPSAPKVVVFVPEVPIPGAPLNPYLQNGTQDDSSTPSPLVIDLARPAVRLGFYLYVPHQSVATLRAYDRYGNSLGSFTKISGQFVGMETTSILGIARVSVEYAGSTELEAIDDLVVDFVARPTFTTYLPQIADAAGLDNTIIILNVSNSTGQAEVRFFDSTGQSMSVQTGDQSQSLLSFFVPPGAARFLPVKGSSQQPRTGYAVIESNVPLSVQAVYRTRIGPDSRIFEAGVLAGITSTSVSGAVEQDAQAGLESALAIVNTSNIQAYSLVLLRDETGEAIDSRHLDLAPRYQTAKFLSELFPQLAGGSFKGSVEIVSSQPLAYLIVRTVTGHAASSLPFGDTRKR